MYVLDIKEQSVRNKKFISALQNFAQNEFALGYWQSMRLQMNRGEYIPLYEKDIKINEDGIWLTKQQTIY